MQPYWKTLRKKAFFFRQMCSEIRHSPKRLLKKHLEATECLYVLLLPYSIFLVLKNTSQLWRVYFSFHRLGFSQTGGTLNSPVRRSLCINAELRFVLTNTYLLTFQDQSPTSPHGALRRSRVISTNAGYYKTSTTLESLQPESFMTRSVWLMFDVLSPLALCAHIMWTWMTARHIFTKLLKCTKFTNQEHQKEFC